MAVFVIADLHLSNSTHDLLEGFSSFVNKLQPDDELYIIGDLFNFFVGLDKSNIAQQTVRSELISAKNRGVTAYFIKGNRDFLMTQEEAKKLGLILLDDISIIKRYGQHIMLSHGDLFCTNDLGYQKYYRLVNNKYLQLLFRLLPLALRRKIASRIREQSKESHYHRRDPSIYGVVPASIEKLVQNIKVNTLNNLLSQVLVVHGHIHEFSVFKEESSSVKERYVLGAWGSNISYWALSKYGKVCFREIKLEEITHIEKLIS